MRIYKIIPTYFNKSTLTHIRCLFDQDCHHPFVEISGRFIHLNRTFWAILGALSAVLGHHTFIMQISIVYKVDWKAHEHDFLKKICDKRACQFLLLYSGLFNFAKIFCFSIVSFCDFCWDMSMSAESDENAAGKLSIHSLCIATFQQNHLYCWTLETTDFYYNKDNKLSDDYNLIIFVDNIVRKYTTRLLHCQMATCHLSASTED